MAKKKKGPLTQIAQSIEKKGTKGALRRSAKRLGFIKGDEPLTLSIVERILAYAKRTKNKKLFHRALAAKVFLTHRKK